MIENIEIRTKYFILLRNHTITQGKYFFKELLLQKKLDILMTFFIN